MQVPLLDLNGQYAEFKAEIMEEISKIFDSQSFILGAKVQELEEKISEYCQTGYACGVTSGSDALIMALMVEGIGAGDEVITTPFTFFATVGAIARVGATPVFVDIDPKTYNIDPAKIEEKITDKTKAIIPVHLFGQCADMEPIMDIAKKHNLIVVEDACQSIGSEYKGKRAGSIGDYGCFSFYPTKNLGCAGDGGIVTANDAEKAELLKIFRNHGQGSTYMHKYIGGNFRLAAIQAATLIIKLRALDGFTEARQRNAAEYRELFAQSKIGDKVILPYEAEYPGRHIYNQFSIRVANGKRDELRQKLSEAGIGSGIYYPLSLHQQDCFAYLGYKEGDMPVSEQTAKEILALPIYPESTSEHRQCVVENIEKILCG
jgi:dTDP-4-amino-4,6-dideoxygalactose transaminase